MTTVANTIKRGEIYHFNHRIGEKVYRKSLKTDSPSQCRKYVSGIISFIKRSEVLGIKVEKQDIDKFIEMLISNKLNEVVRLGKAATQPMSNTAKSYFDMWYRQTAEARDYNDMVENSDFAAPYDIDVSAHLRDYPSYTQWLSAKIESAGDYCHLVSDLTNFDEDGNREIDTDHPMYWEFKVPTHGSEWFTHLDKQVSNHAKNISNAVSKNHSVRARMELTELQTKFSDLLPNVPPSVHPIEIEETTSPIFKDVVSEYLHYAKSKIGMKKQAEPEKHMRLWSQDFADLPLDKIFLENILDTWDTINNFPKGKVGSEEDLKTKWMYATSGETLGELMGFETAKKYKQELRNFFSWASDIKRYTNNNPIANESTYKYLEDFKDRKIPRTKFTVQQSRTIVNYCKDNLSDLRNWAVLLMAYQGMRNSEVLNLEKADIITDSDSNVVYLFVRKGKSVNAVRKVPVHSQLIKLGFRQFVDNLTTNKLFNFNSLSPYYVKMREDLQIPQKAEDGNRLSLYSFRHTVISQLTTKDVNRGKQDAIVGHASSEVQAGYTHIDLLELQKEVNKISY